MTFLTQGIILKKENYRDYDCRYVIYALGRGKISAIAKGVKKITSKLGSHLEFFLVSNVMIANGARAKRIAGAQMLKKYRGIEGNLAKRLIAVYFLEVVDLLVKYDFHDDEIFILTDKFLTRLSDASSKEENLLYLNKHLFDLLSHLGYCPAIKSKKQSGLIRELNKLITEVAEREVKSFYLMVKLFG